MDLLDHSQRHGEILQQVVEEESNEEIFDDDNNSDKESEPINCGNEMEDQNLDDPEPDLVSEEGENGRPTRSRAAPVRYNPPIGRNYHMHGRRYCNALSYGRNVVPKLYSGVNLRDKIAKGYVNYLKAKEVCHNIISEGVEDGNELKYSDDKCRMIANYM